MLRYILELYICTYYITLNKFNLTIEGFISFLIVYYILCSRMLSWYIHCIFDCLRVHLSNIYMEQRIKTQLIPNVNVLNTSTKHAKIFYFTKNKKVEKVSKRIEDTLDVVSTQESDIFIFENVIPGTPKILVQFVPLLPSGEIFLFRLRSCLLLDDAMVVKLFSLDYFTH